ncbi:hypothetical protein [Croceicoccus bisphenolivorans]|uniref:hypothetical protein n=1 Tax=Croceicoccus bisphenolivorans TaxID=1783232 RepID=UPI000A591704|nr:hypothetical protein [Croceicoccus bisphenolivorans]
MPNLIRMESAALAAIGLFLLTGASPAFAYMGAGAGLSAIGSALSFIGVLLLMIVGFVWYPVKRLLRRKRVEPVQSETPAE